MHVFVHYGGAKHDIHLDGEPGALCTHHLSAAVQDQLDVAVHKQKLIFKGKVIPADSVLLSCGVIDGAKVMLMAGAAPTAVRSFPDLASTAGKSL